MKFRFSKVIDAHTHPAGPGPPDSEFRWKHYKDEFFNMMHLADPDRPEIFAKKMDEHGVHMGIALCSIGLPNENDRIVEIVPIAEGCVGECAYCQTKLARGKLNSYPEELILKQIQKGVNEGVKEVWITSQDNGAYGLDLNKRIHHSNPDLKVSIDV